MEKEFKKLSDRAFLRKIGDYLQKPMQKILTWNINQKRFARKLIKEKVDERHTVDFYLKQLPNSQTAIDSIAKERNFAYYQLSGIYKEKFKKYTLAENKYEKLLEFQPEERLVLPMSMYNLYKIYQIIGNKDKECGYER